jgi:hypothetical protein
MILESLQMDLLLPKRVARALTPTETRLWLAVVEQALVPCRMVDLGILANVSPTAARSNLKKLVRDGWISFSYPNGKATRESPRRWRAYRYPQTEPNPNPNRTDPNGPEQGRAN